MADNEGTEQSKEIKNPEQLKLEEAKETTEQERWKANQQEFIKHQEEERTKQRGLEIEKRKLELDMLQTRKKKKKWFIYFLSILVGVFSLALIAGGVVFFCFIKEDWGNTFNWIRLISGSILILSFVVLIISLCHLLKKLVSSSDEE